MRGPPPASAVALPALASAAAASTDATAEADATGERDSAQEQAGADQDSLVCPRCGKPLVVRTAKRGPNAGKRFYGCSGYPGCHYTQAIPLEENAE